MLRTDAARALRDRQTEDGYLLPDYGGACFAGVPATVAELLGTRVPGTPVPDDCFAGVRTDGIETVVHVLVDGFGFEQWAHHRHAAKFLNRLTERARVSPLTSVFPSETATALTTLHTGRLPAEHGLLGWTQYLPDAELLVQPLPFTAADGTPAGELGINPDALFGNCATPVYDELAAAGITTAVLAPTGLNNSAYAGVTLGAARPRDYEGLGGPSGLARRLRDTVHEAHEDAPSYVYAYCPQIDAAAHDHGTRSTAYADTVGAVFRALRRAVSGVDEAVAAETLLIVSADHGHVDTDPSRNVDLFTDERLPAALRTDRRDAPLVCGGPRNIHLFPRADAAERLRAALDDRRTAWLRQPPDGVMDRALFGGNRSPTFTERRSPELLIPDALSVWHGEADDLSSVGMHGGLAPAEMLCPLAAVRLDRL